MKKLITIGICALGLTGLAATNTELKQMLVDKNYSNFVNTASVSQFTNIVTEAEALDCVKVLFSTNISVSGRWKKFNALAKTKVLDPMTTVNTAIEMKRPNLMSIANQFDKDVFMYAWENAIGKEWIDVMNFRFATQTRKSNEYLPLLKQSAEWIRIALPKDYTDYVCTILPANKLRTPELNAWYDECEKNISEETCDFWGWFWVNRVYPNNAKLGKYFFKSVFLAPLPKISRAHIEVYVKMIKNTSYADEALELASSSFANDTGARAAYFALYVNKHFDTTEYINKLWSTIYKDKWAAMDCALTLDDNDKIIDTLISANTELTAKQFDKIIPKLNSLDVDYRKDDVVKALRNINARYTLKLYDDRKTWEPILSKIRALIDVRQM